MKFLNLKNLKAFLPKLALWSMITAVAFAFTAAAAMGLDEAVTNKGLGIAAFVLGIVLTFVWIADSSLKGLVNSYKDWRKEESIDFAGTVIYATLGVISVLLTIVALAVH